MIVGFCAAALATVVSIVIGVLTGYLGGWFDMLTQRLVDAWMTFPDLVLLIVIVSVVGPGITQIVIILGLLYGIAGSRIVRGAVTSVREHVYTHAAQSIGAGTFHILRRHILPNVMPVVIVLFTTRVAPSSCRRRRFRFSAWACRHRRRPGAGCSPATAAPTSTWDRGWRLPPASA